MTVIRFHTSHCNLDTCDGGCIYVLANVKQIMTYFGSPDRPVTPTEFKHFWSSLTDDEKDFYKRGVGEILGL